MIEDAELLRRYSREGFEPAFTEFVSRHVGLVYFSALRRTGNAALAQDIAQSVFTTAARKAARLSGHPSLTGWLYTATLHIADRAKRKERTRQRYERAFALDAMTTVDPAHEWEKLKLIIDETLASLNGRDREAVLLRFFEGQPYSKLGATLRISEDAARMRVDRALEKLRRKLERRQIQSSSAALAAALSTQAGLAVPPSVLTSVSAAAIAPAAAAVAVGFVSTTKTAVVAATIATIFIAGFGIVEINQARKTTNSREASNQEISPPSQSNRAKNTRASEREHGQAAKSPNGSSLVGVHFEQAAAKAMTQGNPLDLAYVAMVKRDAAVAQMKSNFGDFLIEAQLTAAEANQLLELLADERQAALDLIIGARDRGASWIASPELEKVILAAATSRDSEIAKLLGPEKFIQFQDFRDTAMIQMTLVDLDDRLVDQGYPLTDAQTRKLIQIFRSQETPVSARRAPIKAVIQVIGMPVTDEALGSAKSILATPQVAALRSLQLAQKTPQRSTIGSPQTTRPSIP